VVAAEGEERLEEEVAGGEGRQRGAGVGEEG
jgi:hypothetical protein